MKIIVPAVLICIFISCSSKSEVEIYNEKATELITQIISEENNCSCLVLRSSHEEMVLGMSKEELQEIIIRELNFTSINELEYALDVSINFRLNTSLYIRKMS